MSAAPSDRSAGACPEPSRRVPPPVAGASDPGARDARSEPESRLSSGQQAVPRQSHAPLWASLLATFCGIGHLRPGPGSWASAVTLILWAALSYSLSPSLRTPVAIVLALCVTLVGIPAATQVARTAGSKDPHFVVIDEVAGQLVALIAVPLTWKTFLAGFILFRGFDIVKPPPVHQLEALPEGSGIMLDDVAAGLYALVAIHLLLHFGLLR